MHIKHSFSFLYQSVFLTTGRVPHIVIDRSVHGFDTRNITWLQVSKASFVLLDHYLQYWHYNHIIDLDSGDCISDQELQYMFQVRNTAHTSLS
jgi:hypothetical protein